MYQCMRHTVRHWLPGSNYPSLISLAESSRQRGSRLRTVTTPTQITLAHDHFKSILFSFASCFAPFPPPSHARLPALAPDRRPLCCTDDARCSKCGDTILPDIRVARRLTVFLDDDLDRLFPKESWVRVVAHPTRLSPQLGSSSVKEAEVEGGGSSGESASREGSGDGVGGVAGVPEPGLRFSELSPPKGTFGFWGFHVPTG